jgi:hypothetical protein
MSNRWWTLVLALAFGVLGAVSLPTAALADKGSDGTIVGGSDLPPPPGPQDSGDPDSPSGSGRNNLQLGGAEQYGTIGTTGVGDTSVRGLRPDLMMRVRIALGVLKHYYLRF